MSISPLTGLGMCLNIIGVEHGKLLVLARKVWRSRRDPTIQYLGLWRHYQLQVSSFENKPHGCSLWN
jgi:hypothetical protein